MVHAASDADPIVISGMSVEAPGGVRTPAAYWAALSEARELIGPLPRDRGWPVEDMLSLSRPEGFADGATRVGSSRTPARSILSSST